MVTVFYLINQLILTKYYIFLFKYDIGLENRKDNQNSPR